MYFHGERTQYQRQEHCKYNLSGVLFRPTEFFSELPRQGGYGEPLLFGVIVTSIAVMLSQIWSLIILQEFVWYLLLLAPFIALFGIGISTVVYHLCLYLIGGANEDIEATWRVMCYATATGVWNVIPLVGWIITGIWQIVAMVIGLREVHGTTTGKVVLAVFLPLILCCALVVVVLFTMGLIGAASR